MESTESIAQATQSVDPIAQVIEQLQSESFAQVLRALTQMRKQSKRVTRDIYIIDLDDPEYPDRYKVSFTVNNVTKKSNDLLQRNRHFKVIQTVSLPLSVPLSDCKRVTRSLTEKVPLRGRMKYNLTFTKDKLDTIVDALTGLEKEQAT